MAIEELEAELEHLKEQSDQLSHQIGEAKRAGRDASEYIARHREVSARIKELKKQLKRLKEQQRPGPRVEVLTEWEKVEAIGDEYRELVERSDAVSPFLLPEWIFACYRYFAAETHEPRFMIVRDDNGQLVGAAPLMVGVERWRFLRQRVLRFMGTGPGHHAYYLTFPVASGHRDILELLAGHLEDVVLDNTVIILDHVSPFAEGQALREALFERLHDRDWLLFREEAAYYGPIGSSMEEFIQLVPDGWRRNQLRRGDAKLRAAFARVEYHCARDLRELEAFTDDLLDLSIKRHKAKGDVSTYSRPTDRQFVMQAFRGLFNYQRVWLLRLLCDGEIAAVVAAVVYRGISYCYQVCINPELAPFSPGHHLLAYAIRHCQEEGIYTFNFLTGTGTYKAEYFPRRTAPFSLIGLPRHGAARHFELFKWLLRSLRKRK